jgi:hypothetical protein
MSVEPRSRCPPLPSGTGGRSQPIRPAFSEVSSLCRPEPVWESGNDDIPISPVIQMPDESAVTARVQAVMAGSVEKNGACYSAVLR